MGLYLGDIPMSPFGKSAYQQAVAGGYKGGEDEFNRLLASFPEHLAGKAPSIHASQHAAGGSDPVTLTTSQVTGLDTKLSEIDASLLKKVSQDGNVIRTGITGGTFGGSCASVVGTEKGAYLECFTTLEEYHRKRSQLILHPPAEGGPLAALAQTLDGGKSWTSKMLATATPPQEYDLPLAAGISNDNQYARSVYWRDQFGVVTFFFQAVKSGTSADIWNGERLAILPAGFRPNGLSTFAAHFEDTGNFAPALGVVHQDGSIVAYNGSGASGRKVFGFGSFVAETL